MIAKITKSISPKKRTLVIVLLILVAAIFLIRELRGANSERSFLKASGSGNMDAVLDAQAFQLCSTVILNLLFPHPTTAIDGHDRKC